MSRREDASEEKTEDDVVSDLASTGNYSDVLSELVSIEKTDFDHEFCEVQNVEDAIKLKFLKYVGSETVLLVDDNIAFIETLEKYFTEYGYKVILAYDGQQAIDKFKDNIDSIDIILMDVIMPHIDGIKAYHEISSLKASIKIIFMSGFHEDSFGELSNRIELLRKPFTLYDVIKKIREKLDETAN